MVQVRKEALTTNYYYHVFSRSIAKYVVFNDNEDYDRLFMLVDLCRNTNFHHKLSRFLQLTDSVQSEIVSELSLQKDYLVDIVAYCLMPTHVHLLLRQTKEGGISKFMARVLNGYSRYFNTQHKRTGPLWSGRFKSVLVSSDEQLLHLTRYIHLNPTSANLVNKPDEWEYSSLGEYLGARRRSKICDYKDVVDMTCKRYKKFVDSQKEYQKELAIIKGITIESYSG